MVNANVVISGSAVLVALLLTIVIVMRKDGDPTENYSVSVTGTYSENGVSYAADMYFCTGEDCVFYSTEDSFDSFNDQSQEFPGYFALVGFEDPDGKSYVTEHSIGYTFVYDGEVLTQCIAADSIDVSALNLEVEKMSAGFNSVDGNVMENGEVIYNVGNYVMDTNPSDDVPTVVRRGVPTVDECKALWAAESAANCPAHEDGTPGVCGVVDDPNEDRKLMVLAPKTGTFSDLPASFDDGSDSRYVTARTMSEVAASGYNGRTPGGWRRFHDCVTDVAVGPWDKFTGKSTARFFYRRDGGKGNTMVLSFAGSDEMYDLIMVSFLV